MDTSSYYRGRMPPDLGDPEGNAPDHFFLTCFRLAYFDLKRLENDQILQVGIAIFFCWRDWIGKGTGVTCTGKKVVSPRRYHYFEGLLGLDIVTRDTKFDRKALRKAP